MSATKILWGQILIVFLIVLATTWAATQWTAWRLASSRSLGRPGSSCSAGPSIRRPPSSGGGTPTTPTPRRSSSKAPSSQRRAVSLDRRRHRHVGMAGARGEERRDLWIGALGRRARGEAAPGCSAPMVSCSAGSSETIFATTAPSMCCASRRRGPARASAWWSRRC